MECDASQLLNIKTKTWNTVTISLGIFLFWNPYLAEFSYPKKQENLWPHSSNSIKNQPHNSQYRGENATPSSGILQGSDLSPLCRKCIVSKFLLLLAICINLYEKDLIFFNGRCLLINRWWWLCKMFKIILVHSGQPTRPGTN